MILLFDIGNTNTHLGLGNSRRVFKQADIPTAAPEADGLAYQAAGSEPKTCLWYPDGHGYTPERLRDQAQWFAERIGIDPAPFAAAAAHDEPCFAVFEDDGGRHHGGDALPSRAGVEAIRMKVCFAEDVIGDVACAWDDEAC